MEIRVDVLIREHTKDVMKLREKQKGREREHNEKIRKKLKDKWRKKNKVGFEPKISASAAETSHNSLEKQKDSMV